MKTKILNLLMIISVVSLVIFTSCKKDDDDDNNSEETALETGTFTDSRDSKTYKWVKIGNQVWMAENLAYTGDGIIHKSSVVDWTSNDLNRYKGWCYPENDNSLGGKYGVLYQWEAAEIACPSGWHLPTHAELVELVTYLTDNGYSYDGYEGVADIAKSLASDEDWVVSDEEGAVGNSDYPEVRNKSGFTALPAGIREMGGDFNMLYYGAYWWTATEYSSTTVYGHDIHAGLPYSDFSNYSKMSGFSVRCVKD